MLYKSLIFGLVVGALAGCAEEETAVVDKHPATGSFEDATSPKKIRSKPCSRYNLKFYEGDVRDFKANFIKLGNATSDATVEVNERKIEIIGFVGQAEEYINYSFYRGTQFREKEDATGAIVSTKTETQIIVCFRKQSIAVKQLIENVRARGEFTKASYLTKQWIWNVEKPKENK
ncbi:MAG: hypothetical protein ACI9FJ_000450 [Alteromonadaceae bacterium]|jgi:hypothetical protein